MLLRTVVVLLAVSLFAGSVCAQPRVGRNSLKGIGAIRIVVEPRIRVAECEVLLAGLHTAVELRLRQNRVPMRRVGRSAVPVSSRCGIASADDVACLTAIVVRCYGLADQANKSGTSVEPLRVLPPSKRSSPLTPCCAART